MSGYPPYSQLENEGSSFSGNFPVNENPPPYSSTPLAPLKTMPETAPPAPYDLPPPPPPSGAYPSAPLVQHMPYIPQMAAPPPINIVNQAPPPSVNVVVGGGSFLPPGVCTVCRVGKIEGSASCCTWLWCCLLLPFGILPGLLVFCCCCRQPKCTHCGYTV